MDRPDKKQVMISTNSQKITRTIVGGILYEQENERMSQGNLVYSK